MRQGKMVWRAMVVLAGLMGATPAKAAAPPVAEGECAKDAASGDKTPPGIWLEQWQKLDQQQQLERKALAASFGPGSAAAPFSCEEKREFTFVVRIKAGSRDRDNPDQVVRVFDERMGIPPSHAVRRATFCWACGWPHGMRSLQLLTEEVPPQEEFDTVVETLQRKLMELHDDGFFEVRVDPRRENRADVNIRYEAVYFLDPNCGGCD
jgi:hypothetical protein